MGPHARNGQAWKPISRRTFAAVHQWCTQHQRMSPSWAAYGKRKGHR
jgi:hypothetical protein